MEVPPCSGAEELSRLAASMAWDAIRAALLALYDERINVLSWGRGIDAWLYEYTKKSGGGYSEHQNSPYLVSF